MTLKELSQALELRCITQTMDEERTVGDGYSCDLLSWVLAHGAADMVWITVMTHLNVIAVALLMEMACIILPEGIEMEQASIDKANEEGIAVFSSNKTAYELCGKMYALGVGATQRQ